MFYGCESLESLNLSSFNTNKVIRMAGMFGECISLVSLDLSNFNTDEVTDMDYMFYGCTSITSLDLSNFATHNVTYMSSMFYGCTSLAYLDISNFNTNEKEFYADNIFDKCDSLTFIGLLNYKGKDIFESIANKSDLNICIKDYNQIYNENNTLSSNNVVIDCDSWNTNPRTIINTLNTIPRTIINTWSTNPRTIISTVPNIKIKTSIPISTITETTTSKTTIIIPKIKKASVINLGFSNFKYNKSNKIAFFKIYLVTITGYIYSNELQFLVSIKYRSILRRLQEKVTEKVKCIKISQEYQNNKLYNCSFKASGEDIDNIEIYKNLKEYNFTGQDVEIISPAHLPLNTWIICKILKMMICLIKMSIY